MFTQIVYLSLFLFFTNSTPTLTQKVDAENLWTIIDNSKDSIKFSYKLPAKEEALYFKELKPECYRNGWIDCSYIRYAEVVFFKDGTASVITCENNSCFSIETPFSLTWSTNQNSTYTTMNNESFLCGPNKKFLSF